MSMDEAQVERVKLALLSANVNAPGLQDPEALARAAIAALAASTPADDGVEKMRALSAAATPGEWQQGVEWNRGLTGIYDDTDTGIALFCFNTPNDRPYDQRLADARFAAAAVNYVRAALTQPVSGADR